MAAKTNSSYLVYEKLIYVGIGKKSRAQNYVEMMYELNAERCFFPPFPLLFLKNHLNN